MPFGVTTVTLTLPVPAGLTATRLVSLSTEIELACVTPKPTSIALVKPVPVNATRVPPAAGPVPGETAVMIGAAISLLPLCQRCDEDRQQLGDERPGDGAAARG